MIVQRVLPSITTITCTPMAFTSPSALQVATSAAAASSSISRLLPKLPLLLALSSSTALYQQSTSDSSDLQPTSKSSMFFSPRARSCLWMAVAMSLHFGGYEFSRSGVLALFTSSESGFSHHAAYPFAMGLVTPASLLLLYWYGLLLKARGPRYALRTTKLLSVVALLSGTIILKLAGQGNPTVWTKLLVGILFVFQNSYGHLIYTQQWSFLGSVMTPTEGTKWFSAIAGICSIVCTFAGTLVHRLASVVGLLGLIQGTGATLLLSLLMADRAYQLSETVSSS